MNEAPKTSFVSADADDSRIWYPLHPCWIPFLRLFGILGLLCAVYSLAFHRPWSMSSLSHWSAPALLILSCLLVQPELRVPTVLNRIGRIAHQLLVFLVLPLALVALTLHLFRA